MTGHEEITIQRLADSEDVKVGYSDKDIVIIDGIQKFAEFSIAHIAMYGIAICTRGRVEASMNGQLMSMCQNQIAILPPNVNITDLMVSPDFDVKAIFLTNNILQSFLREKIGVWNDVVYVHRHRILTADADDMLFYTNFYEMLRLCIYKGKDRPYSADVVQSLLRSAILGLCGALKQLLPDDDVHVEAQGGSNHFRSFLHLLNTTEVKHRTVESYASELCITPKHLSAICKKHSGKTANEWIQEHVMEDIRYYLKQTDLSIKQVCDRLGFPNTSFFGKYVRERFGMTPIQLRRS